MYLLQDLVVIIIIQILQNNWYKTIENAAVIILNIFTADWLVELQKIVVLDRLKFQIVFIVKFLCKSIGICNWYFNCIHCFGISCFFSVLYCLCLQCFDAVGCAAGRASGL